MTNRALLWAILALVAVCALAVLARDGRLIF